MHRNAFRMKLKPGCAEEYKKRHDEVWPELSQMLTESTVIAVVGAVIGIGVAQVGIGLFNGFLQTNPQALPFWFDIGIDPSVLMFVVAITIGASLFSGVLPAIRA